MGFLNLPLRDEELRTLNHVEGKYFALDQTAIKWLSLKGKS